MTPSVLTSTEKQEALKRLAKKRQQTRIEGYFFLHEFAGGIYECDHVSPWSKTSNVDAWIMVVGQDWASEDQLRGPVNYDRVRLGYDPRVETNKNVQGLLKRHFLKKFSDVYATNAFPFIKPGGMQGSIPAAHMRFAVQEFLLPQIEIIQPKIVICLGLSTFNAVRESCDHDRVRRLDDAVKAAFDFRCSMIFAVAHAGARGQKNRGRDLVEEDWASIRRLSKLCKSG